MLETTVVVIGGGATGMGTLRDLCMRGVPAILLEQGGLAHGTSSRFHGLLHSGGRYAVNDNESARECIEENMIVRRIGRQCVEETEGFFALTPGDDPAYVAPWAEACHKAGIDAQELDVAEALRLEPNLAPDIRRVFRVPDSCVDGFRLVLHNAMSAKRYGGRVLTYHEVTAIHQNNGTVCGVTALDRISGEMVEISCQSVVNAAGSWSGRIAGLAGLDVAVSPDRGTLIVFNHRFTSRVVNRLHPGADGDIFVPHGSITILGTTSTPTDRPDDTTPTYGEVLRLLDLGEPLFPAVRQYRILRAFAGTRPLYTPGNAAGRKASRNFHVVDHAEQGLKGMVSIFGGKLTTYRLMGERMADLVCTKLGVTAQCRTAVEPLVEDTPPALMERARKVFPAQGLEQAESRLGDSFAATVERLEAAPWKKALLCECERVTIAEFEQVASEPTSHSLNDIRRRTRMGMGTCQGSFCGLRGVGAVLEAKLLPAGMQACGTGECDALPCGAPDLLQSFQQERWYGIRPVLWGSELRETELARGMYGATLNVDGADE